MTAIVARHPRKPARRKKTTEASTFTGFDDTASGDDWKVQPNQGKNVIT